MVRNIGLERLYSLGQYQNIKFTDVLSEFPENIVLNTESINQIRYLQMVGMELAFRKYLKLSNELNKLTIEEAVKYLEEERINTTELIKNLLNENGE
jgi:hypothetical protein